MKNARQLKDKIKNMSAKTGVKAGSILQNYMLEVLLKCISNSKYKSNFILKGGMLISSMIGISNRTTMDIDATVKDINITKENLLTIFNEIISNNIGIDEKFSFKINNIKDIREDDEYGGFRLSIESKFDTIIVPLKVDISTGDIITPREINYSYKPLFEDSFIDVLAYNLETVLAEKFETIISRGIVNTRARDFYDIYILMNLKRNEIKHNDLKEALYQTSKKRESNNILNSSQDIINQIKSDEEIINIWNRYTQKFEFAKGIEFKNIIEKLIELNNMF